MQYMKRALNRGTGARRLELYTARAKGTTKYVSFTSTHMLQKQYSGESGGRILPIHLSAAVHNT